MPRSKRDKRLKNVRKKSQLPFVLGIIVIVASFVGAGVVIKSRQKNDPNIVSTSGVHWHSNLKVTIEGIEQPIPANIGINEEDHSPVHTHDESGQIHIEISGQVRRKDLKLSNVFEVWGMTFNKNCVLDKCNQDGKAVRFLVNGKENSSFENYEMQDGDEIEIRYE